MVNSSRPSARTKTTRLPAFLQFLFPRDRVVLCTQLGVLRPSLREMPPVGI